jgi:hypothetical protein
MIAAVRQGQRRATSVESRVTVNVLRQFLGSHDLAALRHYARLDGVPGRQGTGYEKISVPLSADTLALRERRLTALGLAHDTAHDCYVLRYPDGSHIPKHRDDAPFGSEHHRINAVVVQPAAGGTLIVEGVVWPLDVGDAYTFRPDVEEHEVTRVEGQRLVFTVGALKRGHDETNS